jgi:cellulose synthase/poly-beta-1,6-N-acetylglucosamine synthase-like glycosyltransferase
MLALQMLRWLLMAAEICLAGPVLYLCIVSFAAVMAAKRRKVEDVADSARLSSPASFAILVPAHNEETMLGTLLNSLEGLDYPDGSYTVYVVADNCTDGTAELARSTNRVHVYERFDNIRRGKGYALNWLLQKLEEAQLIYDAYVVLDADSVVAPAFLQVMNRKLMQGARALQALYTVLNNTESPSTALRWIALTLMNHVRPLGRNALGGSSTLTGNGMCFSRALLIRHPWRAFSVGEDYQYYLTLVENGERVCYVPEAIVYSTMPITFRQMRTQDVRWEAASHDQKAWWVALKFLGAGLRARDFVRIEAVVELLTPPLSSLMFCCWLVLVASLLTWFPPGLLLSLMLIGGLASYIGTALYLLHPPRTVYKAILYAPGFVLWKMWVFLVLSRSKKHAGEWVRTSRITS